VVCERRGRSFLFPGQDDHLADTGCAREPQLPRRFPVSFLFASGGDHAVSNISPQLAHPTDHLHSDGLTCAVILICAPLDFM